MTSNKSINPQPTSHSNHEESNLSSSSSNSNKPKLQSAKLLKNQVKGQKEDWQATFSQLKCKACQKKLQCEVPAKYINIGKFERFRFLCQEHGQNEPQKIPLDYQQTRTSSDFIKNLTINNESDKQYKVLIQQNFKQLVKEPMDNYYNQWRKNFFNWKKIIRLQYNAIMNTFDSQAIKKFMYNIANKFEDQEYDDELNFHAEALRISGSKTYNRLDVISQSLIQSYKHFNKIMEDQAKKLTDRNRFIQNFLCQKRLQKIKFGNNDITGITQYVIDDEDEYPQLPSKKQQYQIGNNQITNEQIELQKKASIQIEVNIANCKQIFYTLGNKKQLLKKALIKYQTSDIVTQTLQNLGFCYKLQQLQIQQPLFATKQIISYLIKNFNNLKKLSLNCYNQFDQQLTDLVIDHLPKIQKLYWGCNFYKCVAKISQLRTWRQHPKKKKKLSLSNASLLKIAKNLKNLQNIWISDFESPQTIQLINEMKNMPKLKHIALGRYTIAFEETIIPVNMWNILCQIPSLLSIALIQIRLSDNQLKSLLINHQSTLRALVIYKSPGLTDETFKFIKDNNFKALKQLYLASIGSRKFQGEFVWDLKQLETLIVRGCCEFSYEHAESKIRQMTNLVNLDMKGCEWVSDLFMSSVSALGKTLQYLNLCNSSKITSHTRDHIIKLPKLKALDLGYTNINNADIEKICAQIPNIQKLGLSGLCGSSVIIARGILSKGKMYVLGSLLKNCTHLDISACDRLDDTCLDRFLKLQFVSVWNIRGFSDKAKMSLREKGVVVFDQVGKA